MDLDKDKAISAQWLDECSAHVGSGVLHNCTRKRVISASLLHLALEHHGGIQVLVSYEPSPLYGSAAALLRPQFEACVRGIWLGGCASEKDIDKFVKGGEPPVIDKLIRDIETLPGYTEGKLKAIKDEVWRTLCGLTHGGSTQSASRISKREIGSNYRKRQVRGIIFSACNVTLVASVAFAQLLGDQGMANALWSAYRKLFRKKMRMPIR
jgi:hypothetical protein